ncbi:MAG: hypothetical protein ACKOTB_07915 [Planctomycetia bacterium]
MIAVALAGCGGPGVRSAEKPRESRVATAARPPRLEERPHDFVGSAACGRCHAEIAASFARSPMGESLAAIGSERVIERYPSPTVTDRSLEYRAERSASGVSHHESLRDAAGDALYDLAAPVRFALGSGTLGRSYLVEHGGRLYQSPLGWYAGGDRWDLSPGFRGPASQRFERSIGDGCLACHAGAVEPGPATGRYGPRVFTEAAIGCERCHGPGGRHVAAMEARERGEPPADACIVNPATLDAARREDVCNQCHLAGEALIPRAGRSLFDFRPGDRLEDTRVVLVTSESARSAGSKPVGHVEQMRTSRCFRGSDGRLGCVSCHDPHAPPPTGDDAALFHRARCAACHETAPCSLPQTERDRPPAAGSCVHCHMPRQTTEGVPHTGLTDHTIPRRPSPPAADSPEVSGGPGGPRSQAVQVTDLVPFDGAAARLPAHEVDRARGLHLVVQALAGRDAAGSRLAESLLAPLAGGRGSDAEIIAALGDDTEALAAVAAIRDAMGHGESAAIYWQRVLDLEPEDEQALAALAEQLGRAGRLPLARSFADRLVAAHPAIAAHHAVRSRILAASGADEAAVAAARAAVERDPARVSFRRWLAEGLRRTGRAEQADAEADLARRIEAALVRPAADIQGPPSTRSSTVSD